MFEDNLTVRNVLVPYWYIYVSQCRIETSCTNSKPTSSQHYIYAAAGDIPKQRNDDDDLYTACVLRAVCFRTQQTQECQSMMQGLLAQDPDQRLGEAQRITASLKPPVC